MEETYAMAREYDASFVLASSMTMEDQMGDWFMDFLKRQFPELVKKYEELYKGRYSPPYGYMKGLMKTVKELSAKYDISPTIPKPEFDIGPKQSSLKGWQE